MRSTFLRDAKQSQSLLRNHFAKSPLLKNQPDQDEVSRALGTPVPYIPPPQKVQSDEWLARPIHLNQSGSIMYSPSDQSMQQTPLEKRKSRYPLTIDGLLSELSILVCYFLVGVASVCLALLIFRNIFPELF